MLPKRTRHGVRPALNAIAFLGVFLLVLETSSIGSERTMQGRWKLDGTNCYWDEYDDGPHQCDPNLGQWVLSGAQCVWDPWASGPAQCSPGGGRWKISGTSCYWDPFDSGPAQCDPNLGQWTLSGTTCYWNPWGSGPAQCDPNLGRWTLAGTSCYWDPWGSGPAQCSSNLGRWKLSGTTCSWDPWDTGPAQCSPNSGRWTLNGTQCVWDPWSSGPGQCSPDLGRWILNGTQCAWDPWGSGPAQCDSNLGRWKLSGTSCSWDPWDSGPAQCSPNAGRWKLSGTSCAWDPWSSGSAQCDPNAATFYDDIEYGGASFISGSDMAFAGEAWDDRISSISVPPGMTVTIYEHANFGGQSLVVTEEMADLRLVALPGSEGTWNDALSSIRVTVTPPPQPPVSRTVLLVNGSFNATPDWAQADSATFLAIASTYGVLPGHFEWHENSITQVVAPLYSGIVAGAHRLAAFIDALPHGEEIILITHSHGGNVALLATTYFTHRPVARMINLGTPINWDLRWYAPWVNHTCTASSWIDWVQFFGASPFQMGQFALAAYYAHYYGIKSAEAFLAGEHELGWSYAALASASAYAGYTWWRSTKEELFDDTLMYDHLNHYQMHSGLVWNSIPAYCKKQ